MVEVTWHPIRAETGSSEEDGRLVLADGKLVAVLADGKLIAMLVRLSDEHPQPELHGQWFVEAGCGPIFQVHEVFATFEDALAWVRQTVEYRTRWRTEAGRATLGDHRPR